MVYIKWPKWILKLNYYNLTIYTFHCSGDLERKYRAKMSEIELRRSEVNRLNEEYLQKMKLKESESYKLNKELAELALALNMEAQKQVVVQLDARK